MASSNVKPVLPNETLYTIQSFLPQISKHLVFTAWRRWRAEKALEKHSVMWSKIFKDDRWLSKMIERGLDPCLIGYDLFPFSDGKDKPTYLALVLGFEGHGGECGKPDIDDLWDLLMESFRERTSSGPSGEYYFPKTKLTLNIRDAAYKNNYTIVSQPEKLVSYKFGRPHSAYLYWKDNEFKIRDIRPENIIGLRQGRWKTAYDIVGLEWNHPPKNLLRQHYFATRKATAGVEELEDTTDGRLTGWKWKEK